MKRILSLFCIIILLFSCSKNDKISKSTYISSIGFEYSNDKYYGYFLLSNELNSKEDGETNTARTEGKTILEIFKNINKSLALSINMKHTSTVILHTSMLNKLCIDELINVTLKSEDIGFNYYIFTTNDSLSEIYKFKNPKGEPLVMSILVEPVYTDYDYYSSHPVHFVNFCREYYNNKSIKIPHISVTNVWDEASLNSDGLLFYYHDIYEIYDAKAYKYLINHDKLEDVIMNKDIVLVDYSCSINKNKINVSYYLVNSYDINIKEYIKTTILNIIENSKCDPLNLKYYKMDISQIVINISEFIY